MTIQIEEGKFYKRADGSVHGPAKPNRQARQGSTRSYRWWIGGTDYTDEGQFYYDQPHGNDLVAEVPNPDQHAAETVEGKPDIEDDGFITRDTPEWAAAVEAEAAEERDESPRDMVWRLMLEAGIENPALYIRDVEPSAPTDIKTVIADEAKRIVSGARRSAYGRPEANFERIARFWQAYFENTGRADIKVTAADVSPLMRLMKEARLGESPNHYDSFVDLIGYTLTGAEVNGVTKPA